MSLKRTKMGTKITLGNPERYENCLSNEKGMTERTERRYEETKMKEKAKVTKDV